MNTAGFLTLAAATAAVVGGGAYLTRRMRPPVPASTHGAVLTLITPVIDVGVAEAVLAALDRIESDKVTILLHTQGGCVASCVMIARALRQFSESTAIVPYMAISGGTLIALSAKTLQMGRGAYLSAVDPLVFGERAKYLTALTSPPTEQRLAALARDYEVAVTKYMRTTLTQRLRDNPGLLDSAMEVFMGRETPHEWPIPIQEVLALGVPVAPAAREWAGIVDAQRRAW